jgi:hypothetical protein
MRKLLKFVHEVGSAGMIGAVVANLVLIAHSRGAPPREYAEARQAIDLVARWLLLPSLAAVLLSGVLAIAVTRAFHNAGWAWVKALLGVSMLEGTLGGIIGPAHDAAALAEKAARGEGDSSALADVLRHERGVLWLILFLSLVNIVLAVWRPKLSWRPA